MVVRRSRASTHDYSINLESHSAPHGVFLGPSARRLQTTRFGMILQPRREAACVSRKSVPKRKAGIPLDELLAAQAAGDDRLETLVGRYSGSVVPASTLSTKSAKVPNRIKKVPKNSPRSAFGPAGRLPGHSDRRTAPYRLRARFHGRANHRVAA